MNKLEAIGNHFCVTTYDGEIISKKYRRYQDAKKRLKIINASQTHLNDAFIVNKKRLEWAVEDVALAKKHKSVMITDTNCGVISLDYNKRTFSIKYAGKLLRTSIELVIVDILKDCYNYELTTTIKNK